MEAKVLSILAELNSDVDFSAETNLIDDDILDSFDIITLVGELNDTFEIEIGPQHLLPENFNTVAAIINLIKKLQAGG
ncbi:MAG: acyl carrier protein [Firmicutes bacterium]|nr:acyl carrier protein [Bacillota bacterium]